MDDGRSQACCTPPKDKSGLSLALQASRKRDGCFIDPRPGMVVAEYVNFIQLTSGDR
jgi:hypothetical protein